MASHNRQLLTPVPSRQGRPPQARNRPVQARNPQTLVPNPNVKQAPQNGAQRLSAMLGHRARAGGRRLAGSLAARHNDERKEP